MVAYNCLMKEHIVDIPSLAKPVVVLPNGSGRYGAEPTYIAIDQSRKFVRRVFYRGSWELGNRIHGGFWQQLPSYWRNQIFIDDKPTVEYDYVAWHITLLYALAGVPKPKGDPYSIPAWEGVPATDFRSWVKTLMLMALNAESEEAAFRAFRHSQPKGTVQKKLNDYQLSDILEAMKEKHPAIASKFCSDAAVELMFLDGQIANELIKHFVERGIPILGIHDSFIVQEEYGEKLQRVMIKAARNLLPEILVEV